MCGRIPWQAPTNKIPKIIRSLMYIKYHKYTPEFGQIKLSNGELPNAVAARSKARTVFAHSNTEILGSNPTGGMDVCVCSVCVYSVST
jgi:hypothetical protein